MLSNILSVAGRSGLYKLISTNKSLNIIESLSDGKRVPLHAREKVITLSDVSIYTNEADTPLREVFKTIREKQGDQKISLGAKSTSKELFSFLEEVLPNYRRESVYASDVKKIVAWYNLLTEHGIDFEEEQQEEKGEQDKEGAE
ncbi:MAG: DUF5606 domain-containing protein [Fermentimonas sp.]|jgi:hypothetical protein